MRIKHIKDGYIQKTDRQKEDIAFTIGVNAFKDTVKNLDDDVKKESTDDAEILFEYLYLNFSNTHPEDSDLEITLDEHDRDHFVNGFTIEEERYMNQDETDKYMEYLKMERESNGITPIGEVNDDDDISRFDDPDIDKQLSLFNPSTEKDWYSKYKYTPVKYVAPTFIYDRFNLVEVSTKKIVFPKDMSKLFWDIFQTASGKEIMFYGELTNTEEDPDIYTVSGMNFPPQVNYGGYVETVDGKYEEWIFNDIILKGKKIPMQAHTHPDFSAFSSGTDERQIKQYIDDNAGNPFVIQLIVSNPRKGRYFVRWFDLENNTWEKPAVEFTYDNYDVEASYPGIFQFNAPGRFERIDYASLTAKGKDGTGTGRLSYWDKVFKDDNEDEDDEEKSTDLIDQAGFDKYFEEKYMSARTGRGRSYQSKNFNRK